MKFRVERIRKTSDTSGTITSLNGKILCFVSINNFNLVPITYLTTMHINEYLILKLTVIIRGPSKVFLLVSLLLVQLASFLPFFKL